MRKDIDHVTNELYESRLKIGPETQGSVILPERPPFLLLYSQNLLFHFQLEYAPPHEQNRSPYSIFIKQQ